MQDHRKLKIFIMADDLIVDVYDYTRTFPKEERFGLTSQIRRAALSVPTNIVEGCARRSQRELAQFIAIALGSASEVRYLIEVSQRLGYDDHAVGELEPAIEDDGTLRVVSAPSRSLGPKYDELVRALSGFLRRLESDG